MNPENEEISMLFREFNIIAAVAYAAERAAEKNPQRLDWDELSERQQNNFMQAVLAIGRGENIVEGPVFEATAKAILEYNGGQGGLALEEMANIGRIPLELELVTADDVADRPIREVVDGLLDELAERRQSGNTACGTGPAYSEADKRRTALAFAVDMTKRSLEPPVQSIVERSQVLYDFLSEGDDESFWLRNSALSHAVELGGDLRASTVVLVARDFMFFLDPPHPEQVHEGAELETVQ